MPFCERGALENRIKNDTLNDDVKQSLQRLRKVYDHELKTLEGLILQTIKCSPALNESYDFLIPIKGLGLITLAAILSEMLDVN